MLDYDFFERASWPKGHLPTAQPAVENVNTAATLGTMALPCPENRDLASQAQKKNNQRPRLVLLEDLLFMCFLGNEQIKTFEQQRININKIEPTALQSHDWQ